MQRTRNGSRGSLRICAACGGELRRVAAAESERIEAIVGAEPSGAYRCIVCGVDQRVPTRRSTDHRRSEDQ